MLVLFFVTFCILLLYYTVYVWQTTTASKNRFPDLYSRRQCNNVYITTPPHRVVFLNPIQHIGRRLFSNTLDSRDAHLIYNIYYTSPVYERCQEKRAVMLLLLWCVDRLEDFVDVHFDILKYLTNL